MARTTFRLDPDLLADAKALAARQHRTLNSVMEEALRRVVETARLAEEAPRVDLITYGGSGLQPGVDLSAAGIKAILEQQDIEHFLEVSADDARRHQRSDLRSSA
jgi:hypothetical protein